MKKYIVGTIMLAVLAFAAFLWIQNKSISSNTVNITATSTPEVWEVYTNEAEGYAISYPADLSPFPQVGPPPSVSFALTANDAYAFAVSVSTTTYTVPLQWVKNENKNASQVQYNNGATLIIEEQTVIDGSDAVVTYAKNNVESFSNEKNVILIKNGKLYQIATRIGDDNEKVWQSFRFLK